MRARTAAEVAVKSEVPPASGVGWSHSGGCSRMSPAASTVSVGGPPDWVAGLVAVAGGGTGDDVQPARPTNKAASAPARRHREARTRMFITSTGVLCARGAPQFGQLALPPS